MVFMLKSLELNGFKSFAKKSELEFGSSATAIVGPNGSGKSNIVEAFRFVLGEQSIKSMRGKLGSDLIFKGSKTIAKLNRAKVSIVFDNKTKVFKLEDSSNESLQLDFETIEISREVYADGANKYRINGTEVRLKDIHELLSSVNIGSSGYHIISQGQADRLLSANLKDRRVMIEDALGLKVFQIKMSHAEKKLEKTEQNIKEVESLRREIAPHIRYLKKQVDKIKQSEELRINLGSMYKEYLAKQDYLLRADYEKLIQDQNRVSEELANIDSKLSVFSGDQHFTPDENQIKTIENYRKEIQTLNQTKDELSRNITRLEVMIEMSQGNSKETSKKETIILDKSEFDIFVRNLFVFIDQSLKTESLENIKQLVVRIKESIENLNRQYGSSSVLKNQKSEPAHSAEELHSDLQKLQRELVEVVDTINKKNNSIIDTNTVIEQKRNYFYDSQRERFEIEKNRAGRASDQQLIQERIARAREGRQFLEEEIREGVVLVGREIASYKELSLEPGSFDRSSVENIRREIERTKIKLEEAGATGGEEALKEYEEITSRDQFLEKELSDLENGMSSLKTLISDLKETLDTEFRVGITKINKEFQEFFSVMFGGGNASLSVVAKQSKRKTKEDNDEEIAEETQASEEGVEIEVSLPQKKVRELTMLSGGERSLTSIALLFAMSQVNPPPFLVLDETDAALDEANSRRYGDMIERLSEYSQLIVVTHNRETMSRARTLYGVTIGSDGASKLLSIKFGDAEQYAK